ncbi:AAA family ATPase [Catenuloplanes atrovinosus]|uniref:Kinase n=1 Tax=Catenuloplanes atrovinosus TaxID=137266 RepID=A0AAE3YTT0_9ACTN|nr:ATP-binding protein [Catenuloplanes atrovinosus]MDR7278521.1 putative kinase [Catenuloplanes atrovinosus]
MTEVSGDDSRQPVVVLMCGVAGSGKTTYAQRLEADGYVRLSIDEEIWARFGRYGIDYDPIAYPEYGPIAEAHLRLRLLDLIAEGRDVVVDSSFWQRSSREECKELIEGSGARWRLIYLDAAPALLRRRLAQRGLRFDANAAFPIDEATLTRFLSGFEVPKGEGEEVIIVSG